MKSPITNRLAVLESKIPTDKIIKNYQKIFGIDVKKYFLGLKSIEIFRCEETGYRFYFPFNLSGDSDFYIHFQKFDWYYMPWKWEHQTCLNIIKTGTKVLEVGCGQGSFLKKLVEIKNIFGTGLELNKSVCYDSDKLKIINTTVEEFSKSNNGVYDTVCSFEVLEHIAQIESFINSQIDCLKNNGCLIISVPNNDSILLKGKQHLLNMPPHHMGLWNEKSLRALEKCFPLKLKQFFYEPLQEYHYDMFVSIKLSKFFGDILTKIILKFFNFFKLKKFIYNIVAKRASTINGHTIIAVYEKI